jgi:hypothetical protein
MKKILAIFFILAICAGAFACGFGGGKSTTGAKNTTLNTTMGGILPGTNDMTTRETNRTNGINGTSSGATDATSNTDGTNGTIPQDTGGGTTVE